MWAPSRMSSWRLLAMRAWVGVLVGYPEVDSDAWVEGGWGGGLERMKLTTASEWFSLTPRARRFWATKPRVEMVSLSS